MTDADPSEQDRDDVLAAEYALGLLSPEEAEVFEQRLTREPALRQAYAAWAEWFVTLTDDMPEEAPPAGMLGRIERALFDDGPARGRAGGWRGWLVLGLGTLAAAAVAVVLPGLRTPAPDLVARLASEDGTLVLHATYDVDHGVLHFERDGAAPAPGRDYELWYIRGENAPVSMGVLADAALTQLAVAPDLRAQLDGAILAISDEPDGGSPTGQATGAVLALGPVTKP